MHYIPKATWEGVREGRELEERTDKMRKGVEGEKVNKDSVT